MLLLKKLTRTKYEKQQQEEEQDRGSKYEIKEAIKTNIEHLE